MEVLENTENDLQIDHQTIDSYVITLTGEVQKVRTQYATNPLNMGMFMIFPWVSQILPLMERLFDNINIIRRLKYDNINVQLRAAML
jgi:hypothetical protein